MGEVTLFESKRGGDPGESDDSACNRGHKVFCCGLKTFKEMTSQCRWTKCSEKCTDDEDEVARAAELRGECGLGTRVNRYCCKNKPPPLSNCHWVGEGNCADNHCNNKEVTLILDQGGLDGTLCNCKSQGSRPYVLH
ncbi:alpha-glucanase [Colletotrichum graminicola]|nr:alpha-glucanase [Colletotrichum graminicola]